MMLPENVKIYSLTGTPHLQIIVTSVAVVRRSSI